MKRLVLALFVSLAATYAIADARDGLRHWWKAKDLNGDGLLQQNELYDLMTISAATPLTASSITQNTDSSDAKPVSIATGVNHVTMHYTAADEEGFVIHNPTNYDSANNRWRINKQNITLPSAAAVGGEEFTFVARFRWDGIKVKKNNYYGIYQRMYANDLDTGANRGWSIGLGVYDSSSMSRFPTLRLGSSEWRFGVGNTANLITRDSWVELAVTCSRNSDQLVHAMCYVRQSSEGSYPRFLAMNLDGGDKTWRGTLRAEGMSGPVIGQDGSTSFSYSSNGEDSFDGMISDILVYDRALTENEAWQTFAALERYSAFTIGSKNGSADEFSDESPAEVYCPDTMGWSRFRRTLSAANPAVTIKCNVETNGHLFGRVLSVGTVASPSNRAKISVLANGVEIGNKTIPPDGSDLVFWVSPSVMSNLVYDVATGFYPLVLQLRRSGDMTGDLRLDHVYFGGAFCLGVEDDKSDEFGSNADYFNHWYFLSSHNLKRHTISTEQSNSGNTMQLHMCFVLGDWEAANLDYTFRIKSAKTQQAQLQLGLQSPLNFASWAAVSPVYKTYAVGETRYANTITIPKGTFSGGLNHIFLNNESKTAPVSMDAYSLKPIWNGDKNYDPRGIVFVFK